MSDAAVTFKRLLEEGVIDQAQYEIAMCGVASAARVQGGGAVAHGDGATAVAEGGLVIRDSNHGTINYGILIEQAAQPGASVATLRRAYLARVLRQAEQLPLFAGEVGNAQVQLSSVYTALLTHGGGAEQARMLRDRPAAEHERAPTNRSALNAMNAEGRLVLLGGPGSGKSTFVNYVALSMAGELLGLSTSNLTHLTAAVPQDDDADDEPTAQRWDHGALLPVRVVLRDVAAQLPAAATSLAPLDAGVLWAFIAAQLRQCALGAFAPHLHRELLERGGLILLDGLDEVPDAARRREQIKQVVLRFTETFGRCRFLVTSRTYAYQRQDWKLDGFAEVQVLPFTRGQIERFVDAWYAHMIALQRLTASDAGARAAVLKGEVERNARIYELAERPLLLTLIAQLQTDGGGQLPQKREALYAQAVDMLLNKWESMKVRHAADGSTEIEPSLAVWLQADRDDIRVQLNLLAFEAHRDQTGLTGTADIRQARLIEALLEASAAREDLNPREIEKYLRDRAGLLAEHGDKLYQFPHRTFQEYLAACHLTDDEFPDKLAGLVREDPNRWREVTLLAAAKAAGGSNLGAWALAETLCPQSPVGQCADLPAQWGALLAGQVLTESVDLAHVAARDSGKRARIRDGQIELLRGALPAVERALAGRTLAALGDSRAEVMTLDGMQFCSVPRCAFIMGCDTEFKDERPAHTLDLNYDYAIARYPVSTAQWRAYLNDAARVAEDEDSVRGRDNDPVHSVSWHEALAFCEFLTARWQARLPAGTRVTLPSEAEWEKAARGGLRVPPTVRWHSIDAGANGAPDADRLIDNPAPTRQYPWGEDFDSELANLEAVIGATSALGAYAAGASPYGCEDLAGNVWEWTRSLWGAKDEPDFRYPYILDDTQRESLTADDEVRRVVRGGSWHVRRGRRARGVPRRGHPDFRFDDLGFRVVLRSSPVSSR